MFLGTTQDGDNFSYNQSLNGLLEHAVTSKTDLNGEEVEQRISNADYATEAAANGFARVLNATVTADAVVGFFFAGHIPFITLRLST